jgi:transcriptional regulator with XRE-family HTH domain
MLNERLKNLRLAKGMTLQQVGDAFGISKVSVSTWESGKTHPDGKKLEKLANLYGTTVQFLITGIHFDEATCSASGKIPFIEWGKIRFGVAVQNPKSWVTPIHSKPSQSAFATRYLSSSDLAWQLPGFPAGSILIIDPDVISLIGDLTLIEDDSSHLFIGKVSSTPDNKKIFLRADSSQFKQLSDGTYRIVGTILEWQISGKLK